MMRTLEICTGDPAGIRAAIDGGADRIELCSALSDGGLTPSMSMIRYAVSMPVPINVLVRPRSGDFVFSEDEISVMEEDARLAVEAGADGIVIGALTSEGEIDIDACSRIMKAAGSCDTTFHRAFDLCVNPQKALETIIGLGFKRLLTSGQAASALEGSPLISCLRKQASGRIRIMAGAGITPDNVRNVLTLSGVDEIHASARSMFRPDFRHNSNGNVSMGSNDGCDGSRMATDSRIVNKLKKAIESHS